MEEIWKDITNFEGIYQVSNLGRVRSLDRIAVGKKQKHKLKGRILKTYENSIYYNVFLRKDGKSYEKNVHRLVAETFIKNENNYSDVNHKDGNKHNNKVSNLEWCDRSFNITHSYNVLKSNHAKHILKEQAEKRKKQVNQYDLQGNYLKTWDSISEAEAFYKKEHGGKICQCCQHKKRKKKCFWI